MFSFFQIVIEYPFGMHVIIADIGMFSMYYEEELHKISPDELPKMNVTMSDMYYNMVSEQMTNKAIGNRHGYVHLIYNNSKEHE